MSGIGTKITIVGSGTIGLSFAALHLTRNPKAQVVIFDTRPDLQQYIETHLPGYLTSADEDACMKRLVFAKSIEEAVKEADAVQEQGPEKLEFKRDIWAQIESYSPRETLFWSSTSGIPASAQSQDMQDKTRLVVVHPYNPPHIMPLLEVVPSPSTSEDVVERTLTYWRALGRTPVVIRKECTGFVANRLAFAMFREACSLVAQGIVDVESADAIVQASMGPRWACAGPFKSYHAGGGEGGLKSFMEKLGTTVQECWDASDKDVEDGDIRVGAKWQDDVCQQTDKAYGVVDTADRDAKARKVLAATKEQ